MARANDNGWDFVKVGSEYQYKEDWLIARVKVLEDNSNDKEYRFKLQALEATIDMGDGIFDISHDKNPGDYWSGMIQLYEQDEYYVRKYKWQLELLHSSGAGEQ